MTDQSTQIYPTELNLHSKSRILSITFSDGQHFDLPCEYLRVHSRAAEVRAMGRPEVGKENVNIDRIEPQGSYAVRLVFDDGHDTSIYSWETLHDLGVNYDKYWNEYLRKLEAAGYQRGAAGGTAAAGRLRRARVLYFAYLAHHLRKEAEELTLPPEVTDVTTLLAWLRRRERERGYLLADDRVRVTVNRQFTEPFTRIDDGDEIAVVPTSPTPPTPPRAPKGLPERDG
jgi:DUF971 family protein/molybdopterin converting factor small subunit